MSHRPSPAVAGARSGRDPGATRTAIINAAIAVITSEGEASLRVAGVARAAGVTTGAIYGQFESRDGLLAAARTEIVRRNVAANFEAQSAGAAGRADVNPLATEEYFEAMAAVFAPAARPLRLQWADAAAKAQNDPALAAAIAPLERQFMDTITTQIDYAIDRGWVRGDLDARAIAVLLYGTTIGICITSRVYDDEPDFVSQLVAAWRYMARAFDPPAPRGAAS